MNRYMKKRTYEVEDPMRKDQEKLGSWRRKIAIIFSGKDTRDMWAEVYWVVDFLVPTPGGCKLIWSENKVA